MREFVQALMATGRVRLRTDQEPTDTDHESAVAALLELESEFREQLPGTRPAVNPSAAGWAMTTFYHLCQFQVYRHLGRAEIKQRFGATPPKRDSAGMHYSVDLTLRFLPDLAVLLKNSSQDDPLLGVVKQLAETWPLSSVGISDVEPQNLEPVLADDCLRQMYVDRVIRHGDLARVRHPLVEEEIRRAAGGYPELAQGLITPTIEPLESTS